MSKQVSAAVEVSETAPGRTRCAMVLWLPHTSDSVTFRWHLEPLGELNAVERSIRWARDVFPEFPIVAVCPAGRDASVVARLADEHGCRMLADVSASPLELLDGLAGEDAGIAHLLLLTPKVFLAPPEIAREAGRVHIVNGNDHTEAVRFPDWILPLWFSRRCTALLRAVESRYTTAAHAFESARRLLRSPAFLSSAAARIGEQLRVETFDAAAALRVDPALLPVRVPLESPDEIRLAAGLFDGNANGAALLVRWKRLWIERERKRELQARRWRTGGYGRRPRRQRTGRGARRVACVTASAALSGPR